MGPELRIIYPPTTLSGIEGLQAYLQNGVWYIDPVPLIDSLSVITTGSGAFQATGTEIQHYLNEVAHSTSITPLISDNEQAARIGLIYVQTGANIDMVFSTGQEDAEGIPFVWEISVSGTSAFPRGGDVTKAYVDQQDTTISGYLKNYMDNLALASGIQQAYVDQQDTTISGDLVNYIDQRDTTLDGNLRSYVNQQDTTTSGVLRVYIDHMILTVSGGSAMTGTQASRPATIASGTLFIPTDGYYPSVFTNNWIPQPQMGVSSTIIKPPAYNSFNNVRFTLSSGTTTLVADGDGLLMCQTGNASSTLRDGSAAVIAIPASDPYTFTVGIEVALSPNAYTYAGICITDGIGATPKILWFGVEQRSGAGSSQALTLEINYDTNFTSEGTIPVLAPMPPPIGQTTFYLRITDDRSDLHFYTSRDQRVWIWVRTLARTAFLTPAYCGLFMGQEGYTGETSVAVPDNVTRAAMRVFHWSLG